MKTIEERAKEYAKKESSISLSEVYNQCLAEIYEKAYIAGANEQKAIDKNDKIEGEALLYTATKVAERTKKEMINKACDWLFLNIKYYVNEEGCVDTYKLDRDFKQEMEE